MVLQLRAKFGQALTIVQYRGESVWSIAIE